LIRINEEHTISTVMDGEDGEMGRMRGCETISNSSLIPDFQGSHPRYTERQGVAAQRSIRGGISQEMPLKLVAVLLLHCISEHEGEQAGKA
jgi:hypothetical protein